MIRALITLLMMAPTTALAESSPPPSLVGDWVFTSEPLNDAACAAQRAELVELAGGLLVRIRPESITDGDYVFAGPVGWGKTDGRVTHFTADSWQEGYDSEQVVQITGTITLRGKNAMTIDTDAVPWRLHHCRLD